MGTNRLITATGQQDRDRDRSAVSGLRRSRPRRKIAGLQWDHMAYLLRHLLACGAASRCFAASFAHRDPSRGRTDSGLGSGCLQSGEFPIGADFTSRSSVVRHYEVGDGTAYRAIKDLEAEGYIAMRPGRAPVVAIPSDGVRAKLDAVLKQVDALRASVLAIKSRIDRN